MSVEHIATLSQTQIILLTRLDNFHTGETVGQVTGSIVVQPLPTVESNALKRTVDNVCLTEGPPGKDRVGWLCRMIRKIWKLTDEEREVAML